jgi:DeoR/GlpR family transcriptional regulator of sugar metabolism
MALFRLAGLFYGADSIDIYSSQLALCNGSNGNADLKRQICHRAGNTYAVDATVANSRQKILHITPIRREIQERR